MKGKLKLLFLVFVWLTVIVGFYVVIIAQTGESQGVKWEHFSEFWGLGGATVIHLLEFFVGVLIFSLVMALLLRGVVRQAIEKTGERIFANPINRLSGKLIETAETMTSFFKGAQKNGIGVRVTNQFLAAKGPTVKKEYRTSVKLAEMFRESGQLRRAIKEYEGLVSKGIEDAEILSNLGICYSSDNNFDKAIEILGKAYKLAPEDPRICHNIGLTYYKSKKYEEAIEWLERSVKHGSKSHQTFVYLGLSLWLKGKYEEAIKATKIVLDATKLEEGEDIHWIALANNNIAYYLFEIAERSGLKTKEGFEEAFKMVELACKLEPDNPKFIDTMGCMYLWLGKTELAYQCFERSLKMQPRPLVAEHFNRAAKLLGK